MTARAILPIWDDPSWKRAAEQYHADRKRQPSRETPKPAIRSRLRAGRVAMPLAARSNSFRPTSMRSGSRSKEKCRCLTTTTRRMSSSKQPSHTPSHSRQLYHSIRSQNVR